MTGAFALRAGHFEASLLTTDLMEGVFRSQENDRESLFYMVKVNENEIN
ncbi:MAG: hypothetical protein LBR96_07495 [Treponema sp.]|nr:hypothetical protein [Treponema sp.]